jgi:hypothetical protein
MIVHDIEMHNVGACVEDGGNIFTKSREVSG